MAGLTGGIPFVGRESELDQLLGHLHAVQEGHGAVVLVAGEPGIGKTRLTLELAERARAQGTATLFGRAYESEGMPPYLPFIEALRPYVWACPLDELREQLGEGAAEVALLVREVRARLPDLPPSPPLSPEEERYRLFESVAAFHTNIAHASPVGLLLSLDDLHWADKPTLRLLQHLARKLADVPLLLVGTYRTVELDRTHPLADVLADLSRERLYERLLLASFSLEEAGALIQELQGAPAAAAVVEAIYRETDGNPFFVEEVVRHLRAEGRDLTDPAALVADWGIPEGVRQVIGKRLSRLSPDANRLLQAGAVLGEGFSFEVVSAVSGHGSLEAEASVPVMDALDARSARAPGLRHRGVPHHGHAAGAQARPPPARRAAVGPGSTGPAHLPRRPLGARGRGAAPDRGRQEQPADRGRAGHQAQHGDPHVSNIFAKTGAANRVEAAGYATRHGLV